MTDGTFTHPCLTEGRQSIGFPSDGQSHVHVPPTIAQHIQGVIVILADIRVMIGPETSEVKSLSTVCDTYTILHMKYYQTDECL